MPKSDEATFVSYQSLPEDIQKEVTKQVEEAIEIAREKIVNAAEMKKKERKKKVEEKERQFDESIVGPWREYIANSRRSFKENLL